MRKKLPAISPHSHIPGKNASIINITLLGVLGQILGACGSRPLTLWRPGLLRAIEQFIPTIRAGMNVFCPQPPVEDGANAS